MRLVYLYVEMPGSVLSEKGMNFSSSYVIYLAQNPEEYLEKANYILELRSKESYDDILYGKNIEVCGIVGNNGTGKSTALDYIRRMHYNSMDFIWETKVAFSIWEENGEFYLCNSNSQMEKVSIHLYDYRSKNRIPFIREERVKSITGIIYYSDIVDEKYVYNTFDSNCINDSIFRRQRNISTSYYLSIASETQRRLRGHFQDEVGRELEFIGEVVEKYDQLKHLYHIPNEIDMMITLTDFNKIEKKFKYSLSEYTRNTHDIANGSLAETSFITVTKLLKLEYEALNTILSKCNKNIAFLPYEDILIERVIQYNCILDMLKYFMDNAYSDAIGEMDDYFDAIIDNISEFLPASSKKNPFKEDVQNIDRFNGFVLDAFYNSKCIVDIYEYETLKRDYIYFSQKCVKEVRIDSNTNRGILHFEIDTRESGYMEELLHLYKRYKELVNHNWIQFSWGMSSGEKSRLTLFSRFYDVLKKERAGDTLILLDELDYYMHPEWQQNILLEFIDFLNNMFPEQRFQIIFTTHSPITLSDVRKDNILFLNSEASKENIEETFAANIASLYLSAFSMKKGSIGSVGVRFLDHVLRALKYVKKYGKESSMMERQEMFVSKYYGIDEQKQNLDFERETRRIKKLIENIGEDMYRMKLLELLDECCLLPSERKDTLAKEVEQLIRNYGEAELLEYISKR